MALKVVCKEITKNGLQINHLIDLSSLSQIQEDKGQIFNGDYEDLVNKPKLRDMWNAINDFSAFEVMPNKVVIAAGTIDEVTGLEYSEEIPACTVHKMTLRSAHQVKDSDVIIDWGDGTIEKLSSGKYAWEDGKNYELSHDYADSMKKDVERFIVKIYGKDYYTFRHNSYKENNLICRIFDADLPLADHVGNVASMVIHANRLLKVHFPHSTSPYSNIWNWSYCFSKCANLLEVTGFEDIRVREDAILDGMFQENPNFTTTDFVFPAGCQIFKGVFTKCPKLAADISKMIPTYGFKSISILFKNVFDGCLSLTGTVPADKLWKHPVISWTFDGTSNKPFKNCSDAIRAQVPESWGGTLAE